MRNIFVLSILLLSALSSATILSVESGKSIVIPIEFENNLNQSANNTFAIYCPSCVLSYVYNESDSAYVVHCDSGIEARIDESIETNPHGTCLEGRITLGPHENRSLIITYQPPDTGNVVYGGSQVFTTVNGYTCQNFSLLHAFDVNKCGWQETRLISVIGEDKILDYNATATQYFLNAEKLFARSDYEDTFEHFGSTVLMDGLRMSDSDRVLATRSITNTHNETKSFSVLIYPKITSFNISGFVNDTILLSVVENSLQIPSEYSDAYLGTGVLRAFDLEPGESVDIDFVVIPAPYSSKEDPVRISDYFVKICEDGNCTENEYNLLIADSQRVEEARTASAIESTCNSLFILPLLLFISPIYSKLSKIRKIC